MIEKKIEKIEIMDNTDTIYYLKGPFARIPYKFFLPITLLSGLCSVSNAQAYLQATTVKTIQGTAPYLTFDKGKTKTTDSDGFLAIKLKDGRIFIPKENPAFPDALVNTSTQNDPIELPSATLADIEMLVPITAGSVPLHDVIIKHHYWGDDDGDGQEGSEVNATGMLNISLKDVNEKEVSLTDTLQHCNWPYKLTLTSTAGTLGTQYGDPKNANFTGSTTTYFIKPPNSPHVCYAKPNRQYNFGTQPEWDGTHGFKVQNVNIPSSNFPRTGFDGAFFDMTVEGETATNVITANGATVNATSGATNIQLKLTAQGANVVRVTLSGPSSGQNAKPSPAGVTMPTTFNLYSDAAKTNKLYSFALSKWFIPKRNSDVNYLEAQKYCSSLPDGYRVPSVSEYTNTNGNGWTNGLSGWKSNNYARALGGVFTEWGYTNSNYYTDSNWSYAVYWAIEPYPDNQYAVHSASGWVGYYPQYGSEFVRTACVSP